MRPLPWKRGVLTTGPPGKSQKLFLKREKKETARPGEHGPSYRNRPEDPTYPHTVGGGVGFWEDVGPHLGQSQRREVMVMGLGLSFLPSEGEGLAAWVRDN